MCPAPEGCGCREEEEQEEEEVLSHMYNVTESRTGFSPHKICLLELDIASFLMCTFIY